MNVAMVGPFGMRPRGTMSARALPMAQALVERGHLVTMLLPPWQNPEDAGVVRQQGGVVVRNIRLPCRYPGLFHVIVALRLVHEVRVLRPDLVHVFKPKAYSGLVHWLLYHLRWRRRPAIVVDADDWEGSGGWNDRNPYTRRQKAFFAWQERWGLTHADAVTLASRTLESLAWALGVPRSKTFYVPNGIAGSTRPAAATAGEEPEAPRRMLLYTRFVEFSVARILDLLKQVTSSMPGVQLLVVGSGLQGEEGALRSGAERRLLAQALQLVAWDPAELPRQMAECALAVYPMDDTLLNRSKSPVKLLELLGAGVPVVADRVGEAKEFIRHQETGWLVDRGNPEAFAAAVISLLRAPALRARLGSAAARDVRSRYAWDRGVEGVLRAYEAATGTP